MSSTAVIDFSVRLNKTIERVIVFEHLRRIIAEFELEKLVYVGLGSVWFTDFIMAHRDLGIETMISIEEDPIIYKRADYNRPYRTLEVLEGESSVVLPDLLGRADLQDRPWIVWLDYDGEMDEIRFSELDTLVLRLPPDSTLLTTFCARPAMYGPLPQRNDVLSTLFGDAWPEVPNASVREDVRLMPLLSRAVSDVLQSRALQYARPGGYEAGFRLCYRDSSPMVTVGGFLPAPDHSERARHVIDGPDWAGRMDDPIATPPLTTKEVSAMQAMLPRPDMLTRAEVQALGFDLEDRHIESFVNHYLNYPSFAQISR